MAKWLDNWIEKNMPTREGMAENRWLAPIAHRFLSPELWRFTRRSVPRGVALGLFAGFIIPVGQIFLAAFLALPTRANVPMAALATFITNPFTLPFWLVVANKTGGFVLKIDAAAGGMTYAELDSSLWSVGWFVEVAGVTAFGFIVLAILSASIGYVVAGFVWRLVVTRKRRRIRMARKRSGEQTE